MDDQELISEQQFEDVWGVYAHPSGELFWIDDVRNQSLNNVWSIVESGSDDNEDWFAMPGFHIVNLLGYVMTEMAWSDPMQDAVFSHRNFD